MSRRRRDDRVAPTLIMLLRAVEWPHPNCTAIEMLR
jgi:hypothetical protein